MKKIGIVFIFLITLIHTTQAKAQSINSNSEYTGKKGKIVILGGDTFFPGPKECYGRYNCVKATNDVWISKVGNPTKWTKLKSDSSKLWERRFNFQTAFFKNYIWVMGGFGSEGKSDVWKSKNGISWTRVTSNAPWGIGDHSLIVFKGSLLLMGGDYGSSNEVWSSSDGKNWSSVAQNTPWGPRRAFTLTVFKDKIWLISGTPTSRSNPKDYSGDIWSSIDGITWQKEVDKAPWGDIRYEHVAFVLANKIYFTGGFKAKLESLTGVEYATDLWSSENGIDWKLETNNVPWGGRHAHQAVSDGTSVYIMAGDSSNVEKDIWSSADGTNWKQITSKTPWNGRFHFGAVLVPGNF